MLLVGADPCFADHDPGRGHPERPARLEAVHAGIAQAARDVGGDTDSLVNAKMDDFGQVQRAQAHFDTAADNV